MRIMIVDDDEDLVESTKDMLESEGFETIGALSGRECLNKIKAKKPDYILLDIDMPKMDGWEVLRILKKDAILSSIPVAMLTAKPLSPEILEREGADDLVDYITKPFTKKDLMETIKQVEI